ncbi:glycoside hydrolase [Novosphingobium sp. KCTC 2891]|uniref:glycoside hydrolase n=1 Tax=Novosphingobium sp. KCTC 2891 TaxID=2989730 RepID=UPI002221BDC5|nr:glycoside hydrolase [Novosphingobium sp. KCTC 2891]MCW1382718.1 glycoside hydrolase [Novosphingobium sp. KCTC 2891]
MLPTIHGLIAVLIGAWLLSRGGVLPVLLGTLAAGVFDASAAVFLPALGGSSVPPSRIMLLFLLIAAVRASARQTGLLADAIRNNTLMLLFALWALIGAFTLPYIFAGQVMVVPMSAQDIRSMFDVFPLQFSPQNVTTSVYIAGTALTGVGAYVAGRTDGDARALVRIAAWIVWVQVATGLASVALQGTAWDAVADFVRNGNYAQLDQYTGTFRRMTGITPEPSVFASFTFVWFVVCFEAWLRDVESRMAGPAALAAFVVLLMSTSTTAYGALAIYAVLMAVRLVPTMRTLRFSKLVTLGVVAAIFIAALIALVITDPQLAANLGEVLDRNTIRKATSDSGAQRSFWARQGMDLFIFSRGLGVGVGSFRSSGMAQALLGSTGIVGCLLTAGYAIQLYVTKPAKAIAGLPARMALAQIMVWAAFASLIPLLLSSASPDPGGLFAALAGYSLGLRRPPKVRPLRVRGPRREWGGAAGVAPMAAPAAPESPATMPEPKVRPPAW